MKMKKVFLLFFIVLFVIPIALAVPVSYKGIIDYTGDTTIDHTIKAESYSRTTTKTIIGVPLAADGGGAGGGGGGGSGSSFVVNHLVKKGEIVKFYFDNIEFTTFEQPLPGSIVDLGRWNISPTGLASDLYKAKSALTYQLILNGNPSKDNVIGNLYLPASLAAYPGITIVWTPNHASIANTGIVTRNGSDHTVTLTATLSKTGETNITATFTVTVKLKVAAIVPTAGKITVPFNQPEIVINTTTGGLIKNIEIPETISANEVISLNLKEVMTGNKVTLGNNTLTLIRKTNSTINYSAEIPSNTNISGPPDWNGLINLPTVKDNSEVTSAGTTELVIEMGYVNGQLNFSNAVKVTLTGMTGKSAGYTHGTDVTTITLVCNSATDSGNIVGNGECYYDDNVDLIIWTKHFTKFAAYTPTPVSTATRGGGGGGGGETPAAATPAPEPAPVPIPTPAPAPEEAPAEEPEAPFEAPKEEPKPSGLAAITGAVIDKLTATSGRSLPLDLSILVIVIVIALSVFSNYYGGMPGADHFTRAANFHKKAETMHRKGAHKKSEELYKKAQTLREKGEKIIFKGS